MDIIKNVRDEIMLLNRKYIEEIDSYNFWDNHIKFVVKEAKLLAEKYAADEEIVELGALLHDVALMANFGTRKDHHTNGAIMSRDILNKYSYPQDRIEKVVGCVLNHRSSKNATNNEELCVGDADILAHFDNIPMLFNSAFNRYNVKLEEINEWMKESFTKYYNDLSDRTKEIFKEKYKTICDVLFVE